MTNPVPPPWESDPLSTFLSDAQYNERATALNMPALYALLQRVHATFQQVQTITERENTEHLVPARMLMARARGAWLAAVRSGMSGQTVEAYPLVRLVVENAWYALHIAKDPSPPARAVIWLRRHDDAAATAQCRHEFKVANVRATHAGLDPATATALQTLYDQAIDFGGHPNQRAVLAAMTRTETPDAITFDAAFLTNNPMLIEVGLKTAAEAAIGALKLFGLIFPERFKIMGLDSEIHKLVDQLNAVFAAYRT